ncbi:MAG: trypsin-like peptidase domain-containing protein [Candidatus Zixiibacteriota bacterium]|nr:MAG: trypsin-like peptidase domain-containing protein [candidate division Zixibacteria bacterium]
MKEGSRSLRGLGIRHLSLALFALACIFAGIIIASNIDFTGKSVAVVSDAHFPVVEDEDGEYASPFVSVVEHVKDAVVNIVAEQSTENAYYDDFFWRFFQIPREPSISSGSGFFFREDGYILTNYHVVRNAEKVVVRTSSGYQYNAAIVGGDPQTDLAVLKVEPEEKIAFIPFGNSSKIKVGDWAIAIGNPFPQQGLDRTVTVGVISAKGRSNLRFGGETPRYQDYIQTDASINPGNSGGPLLSLKGEAIGVNAAISSPTGASVGIGFAIPINLARAIVPDLIATGRVSRGWLGIYLADVNEKQAKEMRLGGIKGVFVQSVFEDSPAEQAGIKAGDILAEFNGEEIMDADHFSVLISTAPKNRDSKITMVRDGERIRTQARIVDRHEFQKTHSAQFDEPGRPAGWLGMELVTFSEDIARQIGSDYFPGVFISRVSKGSQSYKAGILPGSVITQVNNVEVKNLVDLKLVAENLEGESKAVPFLLVDPRGSIEYKAVRP